MELQETPMKPMVGNGCKPSGIIFWARLLKKPDEIPDDFIGGQMFALYSKHN